MYSVYILHSQSSGRFYVGSSQDVGERLLRHNAGHSKSTKSGIPWKLVHVEVFASRAEAMTRENEIKRKKSRAYTLKLLEKDPR